MPCLSSWAWQPGGTLNTRGQSEWDSGERPGGLHSWCSLKRGREKSSIPTIGAKIEEKWRYHSMCTARSQSISCWLHIKMALWSDFQRACWTCMEHWLPIRAALSTTSLLKHIYFFFTFLVWFNLCFSLCESLVRRLLGWQLKDLRWPRP